MTGIIKVDTIQNNGGTTGLTIDSSGRVLNLAKSAFLCVDLDNGDTTVTAGSLLPFNATYQNVGNAFFQRRHICSPRR